MHGRFPKNCYEVRVIHGLLSVFNSLFWWLSLLTRGNLPRYPFSYFDSFGKARNKEQRDKYKHTFKYSFLL